MTEGGDAEIHDEPSSIVYKVHSLDDQHVDHIFGQGSLTVLAFTNNFSLSIQVARINLKFPLRPETKTSNYPYPSKLLG